MPVECREEVRMSFRIITCAAILSTVLATSAFAQDQKTEPSRDSTLQSDAKINPQLKVDIIHMIEISRLKDRIKENSRLRFEKLRPQLSASLPPTANRDKILEAYREKYESLFVSDDYLNRVAATYAKYISDDDIKGMIQFYETPPGQHYIMKIPQVTADMAQIADTMSGQRVPLIWKALCKEFPELRGDARYCAQPEPEKKSLLLGPAFGPAILFLR
jgi:hypothetical protein